MFKKCWINYKLRKKIKLSVRKCFKKSSHICVKPTFHQLNSTIKQTAFKFYGRFFKMSNKQQGHGGGDEEEDKNKNGITFKTAPTDARFPNQNVTTYCFQMYYDYYRCLNLLGEGHDPCNYFKKVFTSICPNAWVARWDGQRDAGTFPLSFPPKLEDQ